MSRFGLGLQHCMRRRSISRDRTPTEIRQFFMTKALLSESKALIETSSDRLSVWTL